MEFCLLVWLDLKKENSMVEYNFIDLFAGAGGLSEGFIQAGFKPIAHVEMEKSACNTLLTRSAYHYLKEVDKSERYRQYLEGKISRETLYNEIPPQVKKSVINLPIGNEYNDEIHRRIDSCLNGKQVDLIIGGPPCQAYSIAGRARSKNKMVGDSRNFLFEQYALYLERYQPKLFVFENVLGLKSANGGFYLKEMQKRFSEKGYNLKLFTLEANNFGVLQNRKRIVIIGWRKELMMEIPDLELIRSEARYKVNDLLKDLPPISAGGGRDKFMRYAADPTDYLTDTAIRNGLEILTQHIARPNREQDREIYREAVMKWELYQERLNYNDLVEALKTHRNRDSFMDRFKVVAGDLPYSQTVVAHIAKDGHYYIHPDIDQNRSISVREAARLQSFPDNYYFEGERESANRTAAFKQIGNAVPPLMAREIATIIKNVL